MKFIVQFIRDEDGVSAIEYALLAAVISAALIAGAPILGNIFNVLFEKVKTAAGA